MKIIRRVIFWAFCAIYVILCPAVILSSMGYIFSPKQQEMVHTGMVALSTFPRDAVVYLGKSRYAYRTPTVLRDLLPGTYTIKLLKKDYQAWEQSVAVEAGKAVSFDHILLIPQHRAQAELVAGPLADIVPLEGSGLILVARGNRLADYHVYDPGREKLWRAASPDYMFTGARVISSVVSPGSASVIFTLDDNGARKYVVGRLRDKRSRFTDITLLFPEPPAQIAWDPDDDDRIYFRHQGGIGRVDIPAQAVYPGFVPGAKAMGVTARGVYFVDETNRVKRVRNDRGAAQVVHEGAHAALEIAAGGEISRVESLGPNVTAVLLRNGRLLVCGGGDDVRRFDEIVGFRYDRALQKLLVWSPERVGIVDISSPETAEVHEELFPARWVYQGGTAIQECFWAGDTGHIIVREKDELMLVQIMPQGESHVSPLAEIRRDTRAAFADDTGELYFIRKADGSLCRVDVVPKKQFLPLSLSKQPIEREGAEGKE